MRAFRTITLVGALAVAGQAGAAVHVVRPGENLTRIAARYRISVNALARANAIRDVDHVVIGRRLVVPEAGVPAAPAVAPAAPVGPAPVAVHVLQRGETLDRVARRYGTTVTALALANGLTNPNRVMAGARLTVPATAAARPAVAGDRLPARLLASRGRLGLLPRFDHWAGTYGVPADLLKAMTWVESGWQNHVVSRVGARGIGQLMPDTVTFVSRNLLRTPLDPGDPDHNIRMSARFLRYLLDETGAVDRALAAYYQGLRSVRERGVYPATRWYVATVVSFLPRFG